MKVKEPALAWRAHLPHMRAWIQTLTVDVSVDLRNRVIGVGILVQERSDGRGRGPIIDCLIECHCAGAPGGAEEFAILRALQVARERHYARIKIRVDANPVRRLLRKAHQTGSALPGIRGEILQLAASFEFVDFAWVPRRKNQIAHRLAREGRTRGVAPSVDSSSYS